MPSDCNITLASATPPLVPGLHCLSDLTSSPLILPASQHMLLLPLLSHLLIYSSLRTSSTQVPTTWIFYLPSLPPQIFFFPSKSFLAYSLQMSPLQWCFRGYHFKTTILHFPWQAYYPIIYILLIFKSVSLPNNIKFTMLSSLEPNKYILDMYMLNIWNNVYSNYQYWHSLLLHYFQLAAP